MYKAPLTDVRFLFNHVYDIKKHYLTCDYADSLGADLTDEIIDSVLNLAAQFAENILAPTRQEADAIGTHLIDGEVVTPPAYKNNYDQLVKKQWLGMACEIEHGGQGLPESLAVATCEFFESANMPWCSLMTLTRSGIRAIEAHASPALKQRYLSKLISGEWSSTMCLTEAHCGSDLGLLRTQAKENDDDSYSITGGKIFITWGDQNITDNIIHLVLARLPDAPPGPKGISLFLVPKFLLNEEGSITERNHVSVLSLEKKMGLKSSPTCVLNFDGAKGWLVGKPHNGLAAMFTMMNSARLDVGVEGLGLSQLAFQKSVEYARDRLQMRAPSGVAFPDKKADPIIVHPDVRRMILTQKALVEGNRALAYFMAQLLDQSERGITKSIKQIASDKLAFLTPISKSFLTDRASEVADLGVQIYGGHGYISEWGMEQIVRDARITRLYEGTNGIQAIDLVKRKLIVNEMQTFVLLRDEIMQYCTELNEENEHLKYFKNQLIVHVNEWSKLSQYLVASVKKDVNIAFAAAVDYQDYSAYVLLAWMWVRQAQAALSALDNESSNTSFMQSKINTAKFYYQKILPRTKGLSQNIQEDTDSIMLLSEDQFLFI